MLGLRPDTDNHSASRIYAQAGSSGDVGRRGGFGRTHKLSQQLSGRFYVSGLSGSLAKHNKQLKETDKRYMSNGEQEGEMGGKTMPRKYMHQPVLEKHQREELRREAQQLLEMEQKLEELQRLKELKRQRDRQRRRKKQQYEAAAAVQRCWRGFLRRRATAAAHTLINFLRATAARQAVSAGAWAAAVLRRFAVKASEKWLEWRLVRAAAAESWAVVQQVASIWTLARRTVADEVVYHCLKEARARAAVVLEQRLSEVQERRRKAREEGRLRRSNSKVRRKWQQSSRRALQHKQQGQSEHLQFFLTEFDSGGSDRGNRGGDDSFEYSDTDGSSVGSLSGGSPFSQSHGHSNNSSSPQRRQANKQSTQELEEEQQQEEERRRRLKFRTYDENVERERRVIELHRRRQQEMEAERLRRLKDLEEFKARKAEQQQRAREKEERERQAQQQQKREFLARVQEEQAQRARLTAKLRAEKQAAQARKEAAEAQLKAERAAMLGEDKEQHRRWLEAVGRRASSRSSKGRGSRPSSSTGRSAAATAPTLDEVVDPDWTDAPLKETAVAAAKRVKKSAPAPAPAPVKEKRPGVPRLSAAATGQTETVSKAKLQKQQEAAALEAELLRQEEERRAKFTSEEAVRRSRLAVQRRVKLKAARRAEEQQRAELALQQRKEKMEQIAATAQLKLDREREMRRRKKAEHRAALRRAAEEEADVYARTHGHQHTAGTGAGGGGSSLGRSGSGAFSRSDSAASATAAADVEGEGSDSDAEGEESDVQRHYITSAHERFDNVQEDFQLEDFLEQPSVVQLYSAALHAAQQLSIKAAATPAPAPPAPASASTPPKGGQQQSLALPAGVLEESPTHHSEASGGGTGAEGGGGINASRSGDARDDKNQQGREGKTQRYTDDHHVIAAAVAHAAATHGASATSAASAAAEATARALGRELTEDDRRQARHIARVVKRMPRNLQNTPYFDHFVKHAGKRVAKFEGNPAVVAAALAASNVAHSPVKGRARQPLAGTEVGSGAAAWSDLGDGLSSEEEVEADKEAKGPDADGAASGHRHKQGHRASVGKGDKTKLLSKQQQQGGKAGISSKVPLLARKQQLQQLQQQEEANGEEEEEEAAMELDEDLLLYRRQSSIKSSKVNSLLNMVARARHKLQQEDQAGDRLEHHQQQHHHHYQKQQKHDAMPLPPPVVSAKLTQQGQEQSQPEPSGKVLVASASTAAVGPGVGAGIQPGTSLHSSKSTPAMGVGALGSKRHPAQRSGVGLGAGLRAPAEMKAFLRAEPAVPTLPPLSQDNLDILGKGKSATAMSGAPSSQISASAAEFGVTQKRKKNAASTRGVATVTAAETSTARKTKGNVQKEQKQERRKIRYSGAADSDGSNSPELVAQDTEVGRPGGHKGRAQGGVHFQQPAPCAEGNDGDGGGESDGESDGDSDGESDGGGQGGPSSLGRYADYEQQLQAEYDQLRSKFNTKLHQASSGALSVEVPAPSAPSAPAALLPTKGPGDESGVAAQSGISSVAQELERRRRRNSFTGLPAHPSFHEKVMAQMAQQEQEQQHSPDREQAQQGQQEQAERKRKKRSEVTTAATTTPEVATWTSSTATGAMGAVGSQQPVEKDGSHKLSTQELLELWAMEDAAEAEEGGSDDDEGDWEAKAMLRQEQEANEAAEAAAEQQYMVRGNAGAGGDREGKGITDVDSDADSDYDNDFYADADSHHHHSAPTQGKAPGAAPAPAPLALSLDDGDCLDFMQKLAAKIELGNSTAPGPDWHVQQQQF